MKQWDVHIAPGENPAVLGRAEDPSGFGIFSRAQADELLRCAREAYSDLLARIPQTVAALAQKNVPLYVGEETGGVTFGGRTVPGQSVTRMTGDDRAQRPVYTELSPVEGVVINAAALDGAKHDAKKILGHEYLHVAVNPATHPNLEAPTEALVSRLEHEYCPGKDQHYQRTPYLPSRFSATSGFRTSDFSLMRRSPLASDTMYVACYNALRGLSLERTWRIFELLVSAAHQSSRYPNFPVVAAALRQALGEAGAKDVLSTIPFRPMREGVHHSVYPMEPGPAGDTALVRSLAVERNPAFGSLSADGTWNAHEFTCSDSRASEFAVTVLHGARQVARLDRIALPAHAVLSYRILSESFREQGLPPTVQFDSFRVYLLDGGSMTHEFTLRGAGGRAP